MILLTNTQNYGVQADDKTINRLLNNQAIVSRQIMCVLEKSPCDQLGRQLKGMYWMFVALEVLLKIKSVYGSELEIRVINDNAVRIGLLVNKSKINQYQS